MAASEGRTGSSFRESAPVWNRGTAHGDGRLAGRVEVGIAVDGADECGDPSSGVPTLWLLLARGDVFGAVCRSGVNRERLGALGAQTGRLGDRVDDRGG